MSPDDRTDDARRAGTYGFSRAEIAALLVVIVLAGAAGLYHWWERRSMASMPGWVIEDVVLEEASTSPPAVGQTPRSSGDSLLTTRLRTESRLDVNTANGSDLARLPGIGPVLAQRIIQEREMRGRFADLADFQRVRGIGPKKAAALAGWVRFSQAPVDTSRPDEE